MTIRHEELIVNSYIRVLKVFTKSALNISYNFWPAAVEVLDNKPIKIHAK